LIFGLTILEPEAVHWNFLRASVAGILGPHSTCGITTRTGQVQITTGSNLGYSNLPTIKPKLGLIFKTRIII